MVEQIQIKKTQKILQKWNTCTAMTRGIKGKIELKRNKGTKMGIQNIMTKIQQKTACRHNAKEYTIMANELKIVRTK